MATTHQYSRLNAFKSDQRSAVTGFRLPGVTGLMHTNTSANTAMTAGIVATQKTVRKLPCVHAISAIASNGTDKCAGGIERLPQSKSRAEQVRRRDIRHQGIAGSSADSLSDAVGDARGNDVRDGRRERKQWLAECAERVAENSEGFAFVQIIADGSGEYLDDVCGGFGETVDDSDGKYADAKRVDHEQGQDAVDRLGRDVHCEADETDNPDGARYRANSCLLCRPGAVMR